MKIKLTFLIFFFTVLLLEGINIYLSNRVAGASIEAARLTRIVEFLEGKNNSLRSELLSFSSFERVSSRAAELGFAENKDSAIILSAPLQVALSRQ